MSAEAGTTTSAPVRELDLTVGEIETRLPVHADATSTTPHEPVTCGGGGYCC